MPQPSVSALSVIDLASQLKQAGIVDDNDIDLISSSLAEQVRALQQEEDVSHLFEVRYPESWLLALWAHADKDSRQSDIGFRIGAAISPTTHGLLAHLMLYSETLDQALQTYLDSTALVNTSEHWHIERSNQRITLSLDYSGDQAYPPPAIERSLVSFKSMGEYLSGQSIAFLAVNFTFPEPEHSNRIRAYFNCPVKFNSRANSLQLDPAILATALPKRNLYLKEIIQRQSSQLDLGNPDNCLTQKVRRLIEKHLPDSAHIDYLTRKLHMSRSTLFRKLKNEDTSFSHILDNVRMNWLSRHPDIKANEAYDKLGFRDVSAYYKALRRWQCSGENEKANAQERDNG